jgi:TolB-like protein
MDPESGRTLGTGRTLGHYRLLEKIGAGGMGEVWRARDERLERDVALKVLLPGTLADEAARKRFRHEALALSKLNHPHVATVFDFDSDGGHDFLVMEYVGGVSLGAHRGEGPLVEAEVIRLGLQLADGLSAAHAESIVHRDLKPANVRLTADGRLKILDFGLAHLTQPAGEAGSAAPTLSAPMTQSGALLGTIGYMAPEQVRGEKVDARADLWAAGLVLYELATGRRAYPDTGTAPLIHAILNEPVAAPRKVNPRLSAALEAIVLKCVEKDPARRYGSARELAEDLQRLQQGVSVAAGRSREHARRLRTLAVAGPIAAVALLVALAALDVGGIRTRLFGDGPRIRSIAVLPLVNLSNDPEQEFFADGMTEELIDGLAKVGSLRVISHTSTSAYKGVRKPLPQIARELGVDAIVEGAVAVSGNRVRVTAELMQARPERHLWGNRYERAMENVLALQSELARAITQQVRAQVTPAERIRLASATVVNPAAHEAWLRGRVLVADIDPARCRAALAQFRRSVEIDPSYAPGWAGIAAAYYQLSTVSMPADEAMPRVREAARRAVELDDQLADGHASLGVVLAQYDHDWRAAEVEYRRALELNQSSAFAHMYYGYLLSAKGRFDEAIHESETGSMLDPLARFWPAWAAWACYMKGDYDEAIARYLRLAASDSTDPVPHYSLAWCYLAKRQPQLALKELESPGLDPNHQIVLIARGCIDASSGRRSAALAIANRLLHPTGGNPVQNYGIAKLYASLGDRDRAFEYLEKAFATHDEEITWLNVDPFMVPLLRDDPRFGALVRRLGLG